MTKKPILWLLDDALFLVRKLQPDTRQFGYHLALGGGVLNAGLSFKDLDLYFLPLDDQTIPPDAENLLSWLFEQLGESKPLVDERYNSAHYKHKRKYSYAGSRIDVFIL